MRYGDDMTFDRLAELYCQTQVNNPRDLRKQLEHIREKFEPEAILLLECEMMDSSFFGNRTLVPIGGKATLQEVPPNKLITLYGLASRTSTVVGRMPIEALEEGGL